MEKSPKGTLPLGWSVHLSTKYPNKVYYFNSITGDTTWDCPKLDPPRILPSDKDKDLEEMFHKNIKKVTFEACSPVSKDDIIEKSAIPPTAVVAPVIHKSKQESVPVQTSEKKVNLKRKRDSVSEKPRETEASYKQLPPNNTKKKHVSPLNKFPKKEISNALLDGLPSVEKMSEDEMCNSTIPESSSESVFNDSPINDVEMLDVSVDFFYDLTVKKETVFDTTACYYIVVDTNILISELDLVNELKDTPLDGCGPPHIFIPWVVIGELDKLKSQKTSKVSGNASEAIRYLNSVLGKHPRFQGQSPAEAEAWAKTYSQNNDDKILECCMGLSNKMPAEKVILLTNDKNLVNKALICKINVHNFESMIKKVKPDTIFNCKELKSGRKKNRENREKEEQKDPKKSQKEPKKSQKEPNESQVTFEERMLHSRRDKCKREIHDIMSNARLLLKDSLHDFLTAEMSEAYDNIWATHFPLDLKLLKGLLQGILKYWRAVFSQFLSEKDKRNIELLYKKATRPEGFLGDKDECLVILSAIEDLFHQIKKRRPQLNVPVEIIQEYRVACVSAFSIYSGAENEFRLAEDKSVREVLDDNWTAINEMCGIIMDHYGIPYDFDFCSKGHKCSDIEAQRLMVIIYPAVQKIKKLLNEIFNDVKSAQHVKKVQVKRLVTSLLEFIPSLNLPHENKTYPFFNTPALEKWLTSPQNRQKIEIGIMQIENFFSKLEEAFLIMVNPSSRKNP